MKRRVLLTGIYLLIAIMAYTQQIPSPREHFGFNIGDDYMLTSYTQTESYFKKLDASDRAKLVDIGLTEEGRTQYMLIVSSPENIRDLDRYKDIARKMAVAEGISDAQAKQLAMEGKAVVWIDGGLHATEVVGSHQLIETAYQLITRTDVETMDILRNVIVLLAHANPDGHELVGSWYMKDEDPLRRRTNIPRMYQKYAGHDNNRDFYMLALRESRNLSRQLYIEWNPQILYNHHQTGPAGTVVAGPPFRDPHNYVYDPLVMTSLDAVGAAMANRLISENKPGYTQKGGSQYSTWYNGGLRTTGYYHNIIGLLTEIIGGPTPSEIPVVPNRLMPSSANPFPIEPQPWNFRKSIDYSVSLNYGVLNYASRYRSELLYNIYRMGMNSIERGSSDYWTVSPKDIASITGEVAARSGQRLTPETYRQLMKDPEKRDPRVYIIPANQKDFPTAVKFINSLIGSGIRVHKANSDFTVNGKTYPAGSFAVMTDQAFRPHVLDMFDPQDHPNDLQYPGGPPVAPYDAAGWTLAYQMGIEFDRILDKVEGPFSVIPYGEQQMMPAIPAPGSAKGGYILSPDVNNSFIVVNQLLKEGIKVSRITATAKNIPGAVPGAFFIAASGKAQIVVTKAALANGVNVTPVNQTPTGLERVLPARIAIWDRYGGSMPSGWLRLMMENFSFPYTVIYPQRIDAGNLKNDFDVIIFPSGAIPGVPRGESEVPRQGGGQPQTFDNTPKEFRHMMGNISADQSVPQLRKFVEEGGVIVAIESSTNIAYHFNLPVKSALVKSDEQGQERALSRTEFYIPGSILTANINTSVPSTWGMNEIADFYFDESPVFRFTSEASDGVIRRLAWFSNDSPLKSGWAMGQENLKDGIIAAEASVGKGRVLLFGPNIAFRSQPHGLFKLLFNHLYTK
ncbi:MAG: peptidase [Bacteroidetes bacterium]|nr:peptidase [Bacteroidota bacterium]